jgi:hypothetical protein
MNSILAGVQTGPSTAGQRIVISAIEKMGKTTLACGAPSPLLIPMELGYGAINVPKTRQLISLEEVFQTCEEILAAARSRTFPAKTIVWDSGTALERLIHDATLRTDPNYQRGNKKAVTMESALGGYGKAYNYANELFNRFTYYCDEMAFSFGINTIVTCHVFASRIVDPTSGEYDVYDLLLHSPKNNKTYGKRELMTQWADMVGFLYEPMHVIVNDKQQIARAVTANRGRVLGVDRTPMYVAGNRYKMSGEIPIPPVQGWNYLADAIYQSSGIDVFNRDI